MATHSISTASIRRSSCAAFVLLALLSAGACSPSDEEIPDTASDTTQSAPLPVIDGIVSVTPVDEAPRDSLLDIARRRDTTALAEFMDPGIRYTFGDSQGRRGFFAYWMKYESLDKLWQTMVDVLAHGGLFRDSASFTAPWTFTALPDTLDAFEHLVIRDSAVVVRAAPDSSSAPIGTLSYTVVRASGERADSVWRSIRLPDDRLVYVHASNVRSPVGYRMGLAKQNGRWVIQFFVAGD